MTGPKGTCVDCGRPVEPLQVAAYEVRGYTLDRRGGGTNHVREIQRIDGRIWHEQCFETFVRRLHGRGIQGGLL